jgi:hypothetical protein
MTSLFATLGAGGWGFVAGWLAPAVIVVAIGRLLIVPELPAGVLHQIDSLGVGEQSLVLSVIAAALGFVMSGLQTPLYRILEGYFLWPESLSRKGVARHKRRRAVLLADLHAAQAGRVARRQHLPAPLIPHAGKEPVQGVAYGLLVERTRRYPAIEDQVAPTAFGNALRAFEVYGWYKFRLDSQTLWTELETVAPDALRTSLERARVPVDFNVATMYLSFVFSATALSVAFTGDGVSLKLIVSAAVAASLIPVWYASAVVSTRDWSASVQALVNLGRLPLAEKLGLAMPATIEEERRMWRAATAYIRGELTPKRRADLNKYRRRAAAPRLPGGSRSTGVAPARRVAGIRSVRKGLVGRPQDEGRADPLP